MLGLFRKRDPKKALERRYAALMQEARDIQRSGDIVAYAAKVDEAEAVRKELEALEAGSPESGGSR